MTKQQQKQKIEELWKKLELSAKNRNIVGVRMLSASILKELGVLNKLEKL